MNQEQAEEILQQIEEIYEKHIHSFSASSYLEDLEHIDHLYQLLYAIDTDRFRSTDSWKKQCAQVLLLNEKLKTLVGGKLIGMRRTRDLNYNAMNSVDAFYIDCKG